jgi:hypothetical protein
MHEQLSTTFIIEKSGDCGVSFDYAMPCLAFREYVLV